MVWKDSHFFSVRNSSTSKAAEGDGSIWWEKISARSHVFCCPRCTFSLSLLWCKCCNAGLQFLFKLKTLNVLLCGWRNNEHATRIWNKLPLFLWGVGGGCFFHLDFCCCFLIRSCNMWLSLTEIFGIFQGYIECPGNCWKDPPSSVQPATNFSTRQRIFRLLLKHLWNDRNVIANILAALVLWSFCCRVQILLLDPHFDLFCSLLYVPNLLHLQQRSHPFRTCKTTQIRF